MSAIWWAKMNVMALITREIAIPSEIENVWTVRIFSYALAP